MDILFLLIPLSVVLVLAIVGLFYWSVHSGQFDDLDSPAHAVLLDDDAVSIRSVDIDQQVPATSRSHFGDPNER